MLPDQHQADSIRKQAPCQGYQPSTVSHRVAGTRRAGVQGAFDSARNVFRRRSLGQGFADLGLGLAEFFAVG